ncbi:hypothetical protein RND71_007888 [Anisodus tanguticus]|uniref:Endonuclease/exonuclease/phosphatase domain-containing protein n=1 Tax=Anisodus tanguticus TaxID=243964 RepID=A0AAE1VTE4_9SOLA|nr:hypothetical protein RND71_007888 [Anisodus tanguticus]
MQSREVPVQLSCRKQFSCMLRVFSRRIHRLCSRMRWLIWRRPRTKMVIKRFGKLSSRGHHGQLKEKLSFKSSSTHPNGQTRPIRLATFNAALFSLAPAVPKAEKSAIYAHNDDDDDGFKFQNQVKSENNLPKSILKHSPLHPILMNGAKPKQKVSINLPENEISLAQNRVFGILEDDSTKILSLNNNNLGPVRSPICFPAMANWMINDYGGCCLSGTRTILDVLKEVDADILALQDVKAEEEKDMRPLSDLAHALGMNYVFAESWAPEFGNAILSKWPIKRRRIQKIYDDKDFRNVLKATIDVPRMGELNFCCTQLDHLDENWRMKQINAIIQSNDSPHILAGGLNSLDASDYSLERWTDIVKHYEEIGKPTPRVEVMKFLKGKEYNDAKGFAGECESVVIIAKGQNVQGTCKYGTRVDYILGSQSLPYAFVPGSYSVVSSKGTSDHHIVKVEIMKAAGSGKKNSRKQKKVKERVERMTSSCSSRGIWQVNT